MYKLVSIMYFFIALVFSLIRPENAFGDPTALLRALNSETILNGPRAGGMGGASTAVSSPAFLPEAPRISEVDFAYTFWKAAEGNDGHFFLESYGILLPFKELKTTLAIRALNFNTTEFGSETNEFTPVGAATIEMEAHETGVLAAVGTEITENFSIGLAQAIYYDTEVTYKADNGKVQRYRLHDKLGPGVFLRYRIAKWLDTGASYFYHRSTQEYKGDDYDGKDTAVHEEIRGGVALHPDELTTLAFDLEYHRTKAPLHELVGIDEHFDWSWRWYAGIERWFKFKAPVPVLAVRAGIFDNESFTGGLSFRAKFKDTPIQIDYTFVKDHSKHEFEEHEPGMYGDWAISNFITLNVLF